MMKISKIKNKPDARGHRSNAFKLEYRDNNNKRQRSQFKTKAAAKEERDKIARELALGIHTSNGNGLTFERAARDIYLKVVEKIGRNNRPPVEPETVENYERCLEKHVIPQVGNFDISKISPPDVIAFRDWLIVESGKSEEVIRIAFLHYKGVLQEAYNRGHIPNHSWHGMPISVKDHGNPDDIFDEEFGDMRSTIPTRNDVALLLLTARQLREDPRTLMGWGGDKPKWHKYSPSDGPRGWLEVKNAWRKYHVLILTAVLTGMRQGELRGLHWESVKLDKKAIYVRHSATNKSRIKRPKSKAGYRMIDIPEILVIELLEWKKLCPKSKFVFPNGNGNVESKSNIYKRCWKRLVEFSGLTGYTFHGLRHYYASVLIAEEFTAKEVQMEMGHADIQTTFNIYGHLFPEDRAMRKRKKEIIASNLTAGIITTASNVEYLARNRQF